MGKWLAFALMGLLALGACSSSDNGSGDTGGVPDGGMVADTGGAAGTLQFGQTCTMNMDCVSDYCGLFDMSGMLCTFHCAGDASVCPDGSQGQKCNMKGMCRP
jgi:hypothetical protein